MRYMGIIGILYRDMVPMLVVASPTPTEKVRVKTMHIIMAGEDMMTRNTLP